MRAWWWLLITAHSVCGNPQSFNDFYKSENSPNIIEDKLTEKEFHANPVYTPEVVFTRRKRSPEEEAREKKQPKFHSWGGKRYGEEEDDENEENINPEQDEYNYDSPNKDFLTNYSYLYLPLNQSNFKSDMFHDSLMEAYTKRKKPNPAFSSWGGKRDTEIVNDLMKRSDFYNSILHQGAFRPNTPEQNMKRYPAFNSWAGKRAAAFNSWGGKRAAAFNSWGGKRAAPFNSWGGKRAAAFNSWGGKRAATAEYINNPENTESDGNFPRENGNLSLNENSNLRNNKVDFYLADSSSDLNGDNEDITNNLSNKKRAFSSWGGKREPAIENWDRKRVAAFNSWGGKRAIAFNSWGGKRIPEFNSWAGKRDAAFNGWGGKRAAAFNSWGGKRAAAFNSWGGKRVPAFNSWAGKRAAAFNSWGGKRAAAFNSWGGKRMPVFSNWAGKMDNSDLPATSNFNKNEEIGIENLLVPLKPQIKFAEQNYQASEPLDDFLRQMDSEESDEGKEDFDQSKDFLSEEPDKGHYGSVQLQNNHINYPVSNNDGLLSSKRSRNEFFKLQPRYPGFSSWAGKRNAQDKTIEKKTSPAFSSWAGKRSPLFSAWYGNKIPTVQLSSGKRRPAFSSWGGKRSENRERLQMEPPECSSSNGIQETKNCPEMAEVYSPGSEKSLQLPEEKNFSRKKRELDCNAERNNVLDVHSVSSCRDKKSEGNVKKNKIITRMLLQGGLTWPMTMKSFPRGMDFYAWGGKRSL